ncbi:uncharacterized protein LOC111030006 isoform X2 [Myzus persicae]|uniref:uncharacterized protein LOC111030006 isoform X2 n=1 Tax=Myzus persicae TaxID=13164 RepID=UPI000B93473C|nr:uncharacterized protein LOC111030006 isoform X2 [Myzus persicae]
MEFVESKRGKKMLIFDGFKYVFGYTSQANVTRWRCFMKNCPAKILEKVKVILETKGDHEDNCSVKNIDRQKLATTCKRKAVEDIGQRPRKIILGEINAFGVAPTMTN